MPSPQMSWLEEANAAIQRIAMLIWKNPAAGRLIATPRRSSEISSSIDRTKNFFVRYMSRKAAQSGFSDHAMPMLPTATVIWLSA